ncbi:Uncharacterized protein SCG7109_AH_00390 [Chlamydiales bacterium SCGC AG-110-M15]|nr:Uncharacterized protein SCG7109_AH_00390 [Chlamydiales bacterium SCGC AG-110-M15]
MQSIPQQRLILYILALGLLPVILVLLNYQSQASVLSAMDIRLNKIQQTLLLEKDKYQNNVEVTQRHQNADPFYVDKALESLIFLNDEIDRLQSILEDPSFPATPSVTERLEFLKSKRNRLAFAEQTITSYDRFKETIEVMKHPVELDLDDLHRLLSKIERLNIGSHTPDAHSPQLLITDFRLERKKHANNNESFILNMKLLKREYE